MAETEKHEARFTIPMPGGKVARIPVAVLEQYVDGEARSHHAAAQPRPKTGAAGPGAAPPGAITINIYAGPGGPHVDVKHGAEEDVVAHSLAVDATTGMTDWHTDWEYGECEYTDESGFPQRIQAWHRHPFGTEYAELYEG